MTTRTKAERERERERERDGEMSEREAWLAVCVRAQKVGLPFSYYAFDTF